MDSTISNMLFGLVAGILVGFVPLIESSRKERVPIGTAAFFARSPGQLSGFCLPYLLRRSLLGQSPENPKPFLLPDPGTLLHLAIVEALRWLCTT